MWAMWANILKNFVRGPSARVTFGHRPYGGPSIASQNAMQPAAMRPARRCGHRPAAMRPCAVSTLVGGRVDYVHMTRSLAGRCHAPCTMWPFCMV